MLKGIIVLEILVFAPYHMMCMMMRNTCVHIRKISDPRRRANFKPMALI
jgi:hypothetical protein